MMKERIAWWNVLGLVVPGFPRQCVFGKAALVIPEDCSFERHQGATTGQ